MAVELTLLGDVDELHGLEKAWSELSDRGGAYALLGGPTWLLPWWRAYHHQLAAELHAFAAFDGERLVGLIPLYRRTVRHSSGLKLRELRLLGDAGPRPPAFDFTVEPEYAEAVGTALAVHLAETAGDWDLLDLQPLAEPARARAFMANRLSALGRPVDSLDCGAGRRIELGLLGVDLDEVEEEHHRVVTYHHDTAELRKGLAALRRISRLEWADRDEASPLVDAQAVHLLEDVAAPLAKLGCARVALLHEEDDTRTAAVLILDDRRRAVVIAIAVDPERPDAAGRLIEAECWAAARRGCAALELGPGACEYELPALPHGRQRAIRLRAYGSSRAAALARTYGAVRRRVEVARDAPGAAAAGARAAWAKIRTAAAHVAGLERMHLYRGELWTRGVSHTHGLTMALFSEEDFDACQPGDRAALLESLDLDESYCREKWRRGDLAILARIGDRPAGIAWCARTPVLVPELSVVLQLGPGEAYIHDVFVAPQARGRSVAPSMLEYLAGDLRQRDVYRSWALIGTDNIASIRAFEKAMYAAVADVIYARMAAVDRLVVRPPDSEAKQLLGLQRNK